MAQEVILYLSLVIAIAAILTVFARMIRQPAIIAYLIAGIIVGPLVMNLIGPSSSYSEIIGTFAHVGVALLLFIVGLSLDLKVLKEIGGVALTAGFAEIAITGVIGFIIAIGIGFNSTTALYLGAALAFSSTVVVVKILSDKKEIDTLHGRIALGILIVEDFVAAVVLMAVPLIKNGESFLNIGKELGLAILLIIGIFFISSKVFYRFMDYLARNQEALFLFGIGWALAMASLFQILGFSIEIGALVAGMTLASSKYTLELGGKIKPLRDFFVVLFFVFFGSQLSTVITLSLLTHAIIFSAFVVIGKPLIVMTILKISGYKKRTNFLAGSSIAQISEFSLILILLGYSLGHIPQEVMSLAVLIALITIGASSYSIYYSHAIFKKISGVLNIFEGGKNESKTKKNESYDIILFGYHRIGYKILNTIKKLDKSYVVVDYNPKVVLSLGEEGINAIYGDAADRNFLSELPISNAKLIISTIPEESANLNLMEHLKEIKSKAVFVATAEQPRQALDLYIKGIDYVIVPHHLGGDLFSTIISAFKTDKEKYHSLGKQHLSELKKARNNSSFI